MPGPGQRRLLKEGKHDWKPTERHKAVDKAQKPKRTRKSKSK